MSSQMTDIHAEISPVVAAEGQALSGSTDIVGEVVDLQGFAGCEFVFHGAVSGNLDSTITVEHGDDPALADAAAVGEDFLIGDAAQRSLSASNNAARVGLIPRKRYARATLTIATNSGSEIVSGVALRCGNRYEPNP